MQIITGLELRAYNLAKNAERVANAANSVIFNENSRENVADLGENGKKFTPSVWRDFQNGEFQSEIHGESGENQSENAGAWDFPQASFSVRERLQDKTRDLNNLADLLLKEAFAVAGGVK